MPAWDPSERSALRALLGSLGGGLRPGEVGVVHAGSGVGKTSLLVHVGLEAVSRGELILHAAGGARRVPGSGPGIGPVVGQIRDQYDAILSGQHPGWRAAERASFLVAVERSRFIHPLSGPLDAAGVARALDQLAEVLDVAPAMMLVDGWDPTVGDLGALRDVLVARRCALWAAGAPTAASQPGAADVAIELRPERGQVVAVVVQDRGNTPGQPVRLEGTLARAEAPAVGGPRPDAGECVLYSGGASGAEAAFGAAAERHGVREVNYTFDGHVQVRSRGAHPLTEAELEAGDVSLAFVSRRLKREYGEGNMLRRVLQSLWHQVGESQEVFVVGTIQKDGTVTGGTGWAVELARMWNRRLWVFDQEKNQWFRWNGTISAADPLAGWEPGVPEIETGRFCGTGTRSLLPNGSRAIAELFERAFER